MGNRNDQYKKQPKPPQNGKIVKPTPPATRRGKDPGAQGHGGGKGKK